MIDVFPSVVWIFYILIVMLVVLGCVGGAFLCFALSGHTKILRVMERYRTESVQVPAELIHQNRLEKKETNKDGYTRTRVVYKVQYKYHHGTTGSNVVREFESPQELRSEGFTVSVLLPEFPNSGLPSQYVQEMSGRNPSAFAGVMCMMISIVGVACIACSIYALLLFEVTGKVGLSLICIVFLVVGKLMADRYLTLWKRKLLEEIVVEAGETTASPPAYGSTTDI